MTSISNVFAYEALDSRGNPTVAATVTLENGDRGFALVPSGASTGEFEAVELRDGDSSRYHGKGVMKAVNAVNGDIKNAIVGMAAEDQLMIDQTMIDLDGTPNKQKLGANAILAVSLAVAKAAALSHQIPLYRYIGGSQARILPSPMMNIINGGAHADNPMDFQEFMIVPLSAPTMAEAVRTGSEVFHTLRKTLNAAGHSTNVGDEGGFAPNVSNAVEALDYIVEAIEKSGFQPGEDVGIILDPAPSEFFVDGVYDYTGENLKRSIDEHVAYLVDLVDQYPIISIEDPVAENDIQGWLKVTKALGSRIQLTGDDVFCTNVDRLREGIRDGYSNSILVKPNQIGSISELFLTVETAHKNGMTVVMSHRSGETEDVTVADLSVAAHCGQIKTGSLSRSDRTAKYNRLIQIEIELGECAEYAGRSSFPLLG